MDEAPEREYTVVWKIDVYASSPRAAAESARRYQVDPDTLATVFTVVDDTNMETVDINLADPETPDVQT